MSPRRLNLPDAQVVEIRERYAAEPSLTHASLADEYGIARASITRIIHGKYRPDLGGTLTFGRFHRAPIIPGDCDMLYSLRAAAGFLNIKQSTIREYLRRGDLAQETTGMITLDSMERYQLRQYIPPPTFLPPTCCTRCGLLEFDDDGLCALCRWEEAGGRFVLYHRAVWI